MNVLARKNCDDVYNAGFRDDGVYNISVNNRPVQVYCQFGSDGNNWMVSKLSKLFLIRESVKLYRFICIVQ